MVSPPAIIPTVLIICLFSIFFSPTYGDHAVDTLFDDNVNEFEQHWFYYDDYRLCGPDDRPQVAPATTSSVIDVPYSEQMRHAFGDTTDTTTIKDYTFTVTESNGKSCATMPFTLGEPWEASYCGEGHQCALPYVGISARLAGDSSGIDLTGVDSIHFFIKSRATHLNEVKFKVQTLDIETYSNKPAAECLGDEHAYYQYPISVEPGYWQEYTIAIEDLDLPGPWAADFDFDITKCTKLTWEISGEEITSRDTLDIADVYLVSYWPPEDYFWLKTEDSMPSYNSSAAVPQVYVTFDGNTPQYAGMNWYAFTDREAGGTTELNFHYLSDTAGTGRFTLQPRPETGYNNTGCGAVADCDFGSPFLYDTIEVAPYAGIELNCYDSSRAEYRDLLANGSDGTIYFQYITHIVVYYLILKLFDRNDVADAEHPLQPYRRGFGIVHFIRLPPTYGEWKTVRIPFEGLKIRSNLDDYQEIPLDLNHIAKIRWTASTYRLNTIDQQSLFAIDNVYFPGLQLKTPTLQKCCDSRSLEQRLFIRQSNNLLQINWNGTEKIIHAFLRIFNLQGEEVFHTSLPPDGSSHLNISAVGFSPGTYLFELKNTGTGTKPIIMRARNTILR